MPVQRYEPRKIVTMLWQVEVSITYGKTGKTTPQASKHPPL